MEPTNYTNVKEALIYSAEALLIDHSSTKTEEDIISGRIQQSSNKREELENKACFLREKIKSIKTSLEETWKETTAVQYGTALHLASMKKFSDCVESESKNLVGYENEFSLLKERVEGMNGQFEQIHQSFTAEEKKKQELVRSTKTLVQTRNTLDRSIEAIQFKISEVEGSLAAASSAYSNSMIDFQTNSSALNKLYLEKNQQLEREEMIKGSVSTCQQRIEEKKLQIMSIEKTIEALRDERQHARKTFDQRLKSSFEEVLDYLQSDSSLVSSKVDDSKKLIEEAIQEQSTLETKKKTLKDELKTLVLQREQSRKEREQVQKHLDSIRQELSDTRQFKRALDSELSSVNRSLQSSSQELEARRSKYELSNEEKLNKIKKLALLAQTEGDAVDEISRELEKCQKEVQRMMESQQLSARNEKENEKRKKIHISEHESLQKRKDDLTKELSLIEKREHDFKDQLQSVIQKNGNAQKSIEQKNMSNTFKEKLEKEMMSLLTVQGKRKAEVEAAELEKFRAAMDLINASKKDDGAGEDETQLRQKIVNFEKEKKNKDNEIKRLQEEIEKKAKKPKKTPSKRRKSKASDSEEELFSESSQLEPKTTEKKHSKTPTSSKRKTKETRQETPPKKTRKERGESTGKKSSNEKKSTKQSKKSIQ